MAQPAPNCNEDDQEMKRLIYLLVLLLAFRLEAALTVTDKGATGNGTSNTSFGWKPTATVNSGTLGVLTLTYQNAGAGGSAKIFNSATITDSVGNTWTRRLDAIYDPGAAGLGMEVGLYTAPITTQVTTGDSVTVTTSVSASVKAAQFYEVSGNNGAPTFVATAASCDLCTSGQTSTAVTVTSSSITSGDAIVAWEGHHDNAVPTGDSDTTNGSWSTLLGTAPTVAMRIDSQTKVTTGTGTQTWDVTLVNSVTWECAWVQVREAVSSQSATNGFFIWQN